MRIILLVIFFGCFLVNAWAETIIKLKTGSTVKGEIIEQTKDHVKLNILGTEITYWSDEIESIQATDTSAAREGQVKISGQVIFDGYIQGPIYITAFDNFDPKARKAIAKIKLDKPGKFTLELPAGTKQIFISGYNDENNDKINNIGKEVIFRSGKDFKTPVIISETDINNVILSPRANNETWKPKIKPTEDSPGYEAAPENLPPK